MTTAGLACASCGTELAEGAKFCSQCGVPIALPPNTAESKQVTVLFADVVHSMDIAAVVGAERLREIMTELVTRSTAVVQRFGGTVDKFTGDGIMALFGAPVALEDHAFRACLAALAMQKQSAALAAEVKRRDGIELKLRIGLNSGEVIAGGIDSSPMSYTVIGEQVGMAQRMESAASPGGILLSESTARLVERVGTLGEPATVHIKGTDVPVRARELLSAGDDAPRRRSDSTLVGRTWEIATVSAILDEAIRGAGCIVGIMGSPGIGKSRLVREAVSLAERRGVDVFTTYCESHTSDIAFRVVTRLLRAGIGLDGLDAPTARAHIRSRIPEADPEDLLLFDDLLGVGDPTVEMPQIAPDARRRRLTALVNAASMARREPALYVIEDAHWIDDVSESMLTEFLAVIPQTPSLVLITYRPEYRGALTRVPGTQTLALRPLTDVHTSALTAELVGPHPSVTDLAALVVERAAGNPFFVEEIVRDLAERDVLDGQLGGYVLRGPVADVTVPATLQTTIAARIDRLDPAGKRTINAAAVIGARFTPELLTGLAVDPVVDELVQAQLIEQVRFTPRAEYAFRHPLIQKVAYESQLKSARADLHRRLAATIEQADENAALIAEHLEAAGDLRDAYGWHTRAATWSTHRDNTAAQTSWQRARDVADRLPADDRDRDSMRIAPRTVLAGTAWRVGGSGADTGFDELRELCTLTGDHQSLAIGMAGQVMANHFNAHRREASQLATEHVALLESMGDPTLTLAASVAGLITWHENAEFTRMLQWAQRVIDLADGDLTRGNTIMGSPLVVAIMFRGVAHCGLGIPTWRNDVSETLEIAPALDPIMHAGTNWYTYLTAIPHGVLLADTTTLHNTSRALAHAERSGDDIPLNLAHGAHGVALFNKSAETRAAGLSLLTQVRDAALRERFTLSAVPFVDIHIAADKATHGDLDGAVDLSRAVFDDTVNSGRSVCTPLAATVVTESLLRRDADGDIDEAQSVIERLAAVPVDPGYVFHELPLLRLRALLSQARGDDGYRDFRDRYRKMANDLGFEGHMAIAEAMP
jgi:adenylate cyclase